MPLKFIHRNYLKYNIGNGFLCCHIDALHAIPPNADLFTDKIVANLIAQTGCAGIIGTISRRKVDLNRAPDGENDKALQEYKDALRDILSHLGILNYEKHQVSNPYLHLSIHGMKDVHHGPFAIEVGTLHGQLCTAVIKDWFQEILTIKSKEIMPDIEIVFDKIFSGDKSILYHRLGDGKDYPGYDLNFNTFQIEISRTLREAHQAQIIALFSQVITDFQAKFVT